MFGTTVYNKSIRKCIVSFATIFNNIELNRYDENGDIISKFKVPLKYGSKDKLIQRAKARPDLLEDDKVQYTVPRMSFVMTNIQYDNSRKLNLTQKITSNSLKEAGKDTYFSPAPYRITFELSILTKTNDEALEIIEKIVPIFQPTFFITINLAEEYEERRDIAFTLNNIGYADEFEGSFDNSRLILYTLTFEAKTYIMSPPSNATSIIKKAIVNIYAGLDNTSGGRKLTSTPKALQDYNSDNVIDELDDPLIIPGDDFETIEIWEDFNG